VVLACARPHPGATSIARAPSGPPLGSVTFEAFVYEVSGCTPPARVTDPVLHNYLDRTYPDHLRRARVQGLITVTGVVDENGRVSKVLLVTGAHPQLDAAAVSDIQNWRLAPASCDGAPISASFAVTLRYSIS
jgi:TonB family protein